MQLGKLIGMSLFATLLSACADMFEPKYRWYPSESSPRGYPIDLIRDCWLPQLRSDAFYAITWFQLLNPAQTNSYQAVTSADNAV